MSAAMLMQLWGDTMLTTALLVVAVLLIRKPFARYFGPRLTYSLWLIPALRLVLPPLPLADPEALSIASPATNAALLAPADTITAAAQLPSWSLADAMPHLFLVWAAGMIAVILIALLSHKRFRNAVLADAVELDPIGSIRLVMTEAVDGPVAFGLWRRVVAVPHDFFARYIAEERALAIDHELAHHRHGDLWANAAALMLLASQWYNPFAWRAVRAFRFDQEAACDARVLTMADQDARQVRAARYATAIAKAAVGSRLSLAAPMAVHDNLQERLTMLLQQDISKTRGVAGRLLVGGATLAILATTATLVPAGMAAASAQSVEIPEIPQPPAPSSPAGVPLASEAPAAPGVMVFTSANEDVTESISTTDDGKRREVHRIRIRRDGDGKAHAAAVAPADDGASRAPQGRRIEFRTTGGLSRDDVLATLREQGITGKQAEGIADKLEAKRKGRMLTALAPMPAMPPIAPMAPAAWAPTHGHAVSAVRCGTGKATPTVDREEVSGGKRSHYVMISCSDGSESKAARLTALKKARDRVLESEGGLSANMRAKVAADFDRAIAETEKSGH